MKKTILRKKRIHITDLNKKNIKKTKIGVLFISNKLNSYKVNKPIKLNLTKIYYKNNSIFNLIETSKKTDMLNHIKKHYKINEKDILNIINIYNINNLKLYIIYIPFELIIKDYTHKVFFDFLNEPILDNNIYEQIVKKNYNINDDTYLNSIFKCREIKIKVKDIYYYLVGFI